MPEFVPRAEAVEAVVSRLDALENTSDAFIADVLESDDWKSHIARAAIAAFCKVEGLRIEKIPAHGGLTKTVIPARQRLVGKWTEVPDE